MRTRLAVVFAFLTSTVLFVDDPLARPVGHASAANTWAGVWNTDFGKLTLDAGGSGSYEGFNPGTVSGTVTGDVDKGTWHQPGDPPKNGTFTWTLSADGKSFSGSWAYDSGGCGSACGWSGTCIEGACLKNSLAPPTPPPTEPPPTACPSGAFAWASACGDTGVKPVNAISTRRNIWGKALHLGDLKPGQSLRPSSPPLGPKQKKATVEVKEPAGDAVVAVADSRFRRYARMRCAYVAAKTVDQLTREIERRERSGAPRDPADLRIEFNLVHFHALTLLDTCLEMVDRALAAGEVAYRARLSAHATRRCPVLGMGVKTSRQSDGKGQAGFDPGHSQALALKVTCTEIADGMRLNVQPKDPSKSLRSVVGERLLVGVVQPHTAEANAPVSVRFSRP
jgi:hypothetical protein